MAYPGLALSGEVCGQRGPHLLIEGGGLSLSRQGTGMAKGEASSCSTK